MLLPLARGYASLIGLLLGARVDLVVQPPTPSTALEMAAALATGRIDQLSITATGNPEAWSLLPFGSFTLEGEALQLGWKIPALMCAPAWLLVARPLYCSRSLQ